jgi:hypothetical protein
MLAERDPDIGQAVVKLKELSQDERMRELAISREKLEWDIDSRERGAERRGQIEAQRTIARQMLQRGRPLAEIMEDTGLSLVELQALQAEGRTRH